MDSSHLWVGYSIPGESRCIIEPETLVKHLGIFGSTGSGKTVLGKILIEELALQDIPSIIIDPQGDISSLMIRNSDDILQEKLGDVARADRFFENADVRVFTPTSNKGISLSLNPVIYPPNSIDDVEAIRILDNASNTLIELLIKLVKYPRSKQMNSKSTIYSILYDCWQKGEVVKDIETLTKLISEDEKIYAKFMSDNDKEKLVIALNNLLIGTTGLLFSGKERLDISNLIEKRNGKVPVNIIFLKSLLNKNERHLFVSVLIQSIYSWMIQQGSSPNLKCFFYMDEVAPYMPSGMSSPPGKDMLLLLLRQARKYGIICGLATQSPKDIDYHGFDQLNSLFFGRIITQQSKKVIERILDTKLPRDELEKIMDEISTLTSSNFIAFMPDLKKGAIMHFHTRYLFSRHITLTESDLPKYQERIAHADESDVEPNIPHGESQQRKTNLQMQNTPRLDFHIFPGIKDELMDDVIERTIEYGFFDEIVDNNNVQSYCDISPPDESIIRKIIQFIERFEFYITFSGISRNGLMVCVLRNETASISIGVLFSNQKMRVGFICGSESRREKGVLKKILDGCLKIIEKLTIDAG